MTAEPTTGIDEQDLAALRESVRDFLADHSGEEAVRKIIDDPDRSGLDPVVWSRMAELGLTGLTVPEEHGGAGYGLPELRVVLEEQGRALLCSPFLASAVFATQALLAAGDADACARYLPGIGDGSTIATLAVSERGGSWDPVLVATRAVPGDRGWLLSGTKSFVLSASVADLLLVVARTRGGPGLFAVERGAPGLEVRSLATLDGTRPVADLTLHDTPARLVGTAGTASAVIRRVIDLGGLALAAEQVGAARRCLEMSVAYAQDRRQFGRPIGSFQAIKHKLADMLVRVELADAATEAACLVAGVNDADSAVAAVAAHVTASEAFAFVAAETIQVHGGIGFTWEHPAHLYFRRARASQNLLGGPAVYHERLLDRMGV